MQRSRPTATLWTRKQERTPPSDPEVQEAAPEPTVEEEEGPPPNMEAVEVTFGPGIHKRKLLVTQPTSLNDLLS